MNGGPRYSEGIPKMDTAERRLEEQGNTVFTESTRPGRIKSKLNGSTRYIGTVIGENAMACVIAGLFNGQATTSGLHSLAAHSFPG